MAFKAAFCLLASQANCFDADILPFDANFMKILVIGASGRVGRYLVEYALQKGHDVTAFARNIEELGLEHPQLTTFRGDVLYPALIEAALPGHQAVLSVIGVRRFYGPITLLSTGMANIIASMHKVGVKRLITLTGAGILQETEDHLIMDSLSFQIGRAHV
jgi:putative NADH-flavin reductase